MSFASDHVSSSCKRRRICVFLVFLESSWSGERDLLGRSVCASLRIRKLGDDESIVHRIRGLATTLFNSGGSRNELQQVHQQEVEKLKEFSRFLESA
jgi:hypothetical protein